MQLLSFLVLMIGITFVLRTSLVFRERGVIHESAVTKTGTLGILVQLLLPFFVNQNRLGWILPACLLPLLPIGFLLFLEHKTIAVFKARVPIFLDRWILNMRLGKSLSSAREAALRQEGDRFQTLMRPLFATRSSEREQHLLLAKNVRRELEQIAQINHAALERLENLRSHLRKTAEFRRKSGQAVLQTTIQSIVMLGLLIALALFNLQRYGWTRCGDLICLAAFLSLIGLMVMMRLARKSSWKL